MDDSRNVGRSNKRKRLAEIGRRLKEQHDEDWVLLGSADDRVAAVAQAWRGLADLGVDLPPRSRPTYRDFWAAGIADTDIRIDHAYLGPERGTCMIQISVRGTALGSARRGS
ncbi:hypothetical protein GCM10027290_50820 [Micromonospora sonneratiae]